MRVVLTRPSGDAKDWEEGLRAAGHEVILLPLIAIGPAPDPSELVRRWAKLGQFNAVMFVSANAVKRFFGARPAQVGSKNHWPWPHLRFWTTGPGTARALLVHDVPFHQIDTPAADASVFDSESLWQCVQGQVKEAHAVLIVRGVSLPEFEPSSQGSGRDWLADRIREAGAGVEFCVAYQRAIPRLTQSQLLAVERCVKGGAVWLFSSSEAIANLRKSLPAIDLQKAIALCTHSRIANAARATGFGVVREARPVLADVLGSIESSA